MLRFVQYVMIAVRVVVGWRRGDGNDCGWLKKDGCAVEHWGVVQIAVGLVGKK